MRREERLSDLRATLALKRRGLARGWYRFSRNPLSVLGLVILILIVLGLRLGRCSLIL